MENIEQIPDVERCPMCGAIRYGEDTDRPERLGAEAFRELAAIAHGNPAKALVILEWYHGETITDLTDRYPVVRQTIHRWLDEAREMLHSDNP